MKEGNGGKGKTAGKFQCALCTRIPTIMAVRGNFDINIRVMRSNVTFEGHDTLSMHYRGQPCRGLSLIIVKIGGYDDLETT